MKPTLFLVLLLCGFGFTQEATFSCDGVKTPVGASQPTPRAYGYGAILHSLDANANPREKFFIVGGTESSPYAFFGSDLRETWSLDFGTNSWSILEFFNADAFGFAPLVAFVPKEENDGVTDCLMSFGGFKPPTKRAFGPFLTTVRGDNSAFVIPVVSQDFSVISLFGGSMVFVNYNINGVSERGLLVYGGGFGSRASPQQNSAMFFMTLPSIFPQSVVNETLASLRKPLPNFPAPQDRMAHAAIFVKTTTSAKMIIFGGLTPFSSSSFGTVPDQYLNDMWSFNLLTNIWTQITTTLKPSPRAYFSFTPLLGPNYLLFGGEDFFGTRGDLWAFDTDRLEWAALPLPEGSFSRGCFKVLAGTFSSYSPAQKSIISFGGFLNVTFPPEANVTFFTGNHEPEPTTWTVSISNPDTIVLDTNNPAPGRPQPPRQVELLPVAFTVKSGTLTLPATGLAGLFSDNDNQTAVFQAPVGDIFRAELIYIVQGIESDPKAAWNFTFVFSSIDTWVFFGISLTGSRIRLGDTLTSVNVVNGGGFTVAHVMVVDHPLIEFVQADNQTLQFGSLLTIVVESALPGQNLTRSGSLPSAEVDSARIDLCLQCSPPQQVTPPVPPFPLGLAIGLGVGIGLVVIGGLIVGLLLFKRYKKKAKKLNEDTELPETATAELTGLRTVTDVTIERKIGAGNFGEVFLGLAFNKSTKVALKRLKESDMKGFLNELEILCQMSHPNVVRFYGIYNSDKKEQYLVTEYVDKGSLLSYLEHNAKKLEENDLFKMALDTAKGMAYLASKGIVHRDLSARNLLVDSFNTVKVSDFGLAKKSSTLSEKPSDDTSVAVFWASPEVLLENSFSEKSDVWSFGITCYEIMTFGGRPYPGMNQQQVFQQVVEEKYRMSKLKSINDVMWDVMTKCWAQKPENRPTFGELSRDIALLIKEHDSTMESSASFDVKKTSRKNTGKYDNYGSGDVKPYGDDDTSQKPEKKDSTYQMSALPEKKESAYQLSALPEKKDSIYQMSALPEKKKENEYEMSTSLMMKKEDLYVVSPSTEHLYVNSASVKSQDALLK